MNQKEAERVSGRKFAEIMGCAPSYISKLKTAGVLHRCYDDQDMIDPEIAIEEIEASRDPSKEHVRQRWESYRAGDTEHLSDSGDMASRMGTTDSGNGSGVRAAGTDGEGAEPPRRNEDVPAGRQASEPPASANALSFNDARTQKEIFQAKTAELDYRRRAGELVEKKLVGNAARSTAVIVRGGLAQILDRQPQVLASITDPVRIQEILRQEFDRIMNAFAEELSREIDVNTTSPDPRPAGT